jgi:acylphosphatase
MLPFGNIIHENMQNTIHFIVTGRVQGVFFRASCKAVADRYRIHGWVRNRPDGSVEGVATAEDTALAQLRDWLGQGPELANVENLQVRQVTLQQFDSFEIR